MARRRYSGMVSLGALPIVGENVNGMDVLVGAIAGFIASAGVPAIIKKVAPQLAAQVEATAGKAMPFVSGLSAGAILYYAQRNQNSSRATGHALGAGLAGLLVSGLSWAKEAKPLGLDFADAVSLNLSDYNGLLVDNAQRSLNGLIVDNNAALSELGATSMGGDDEMGYADIVALQA